MNDYRQTGHGDTPRFLGELVERLTNRIEELSLSFEERVDAIEDIGLGSDSGTAANTLSSDLAVLRSEIIRARRYLKPQRDALTRLTAAELPWIDPADRQSLAEATNRTQRGSFVECRVAHS